jgi:hypothetical protein
MRLNPESLSLNVPYLPKNFAWANAWHYLPEILSLIGRKVSAVSHALLVRVGSWDWE